MKRRLFSLLLGSAPVGMIPMPDAPPNPTGLLNVPRNLGFVDSMADNTERSLSPLEILQNKNRRRFYDAKETYEQAMRRRIYRMNGNIPPDANIASLKSVSAQHRLHMQEAAADRLMMEQRSWIEKLAAKFGIEEPKPARNHGDSYPTAGQSAKGW